MSLKSLQQMLEERHAKQEKDAQRFREVEQDLCMLCHAEGPDKRSLTMSCFYEISEVVPEAIDLRRVEGRENDGYYLRICKNCRGEFLALMREWRDAMIARRDVFKDEDGCDEEAPEGATIPVREDGRTIYLTPAAYTEKYDREGYSL